MDSTAVAAEELENAPQQESLLNVSQAEEAEASPEAPMPLHEDSDKPVGEEAESDDTPLERPDYYPEKFWDDEGPDVEKLAKSYAELEKQFKQGKHKAPEEYDLSSLEDAGLYAEDQVMDVYKDWAKENGISQKSFEELAQAVLSTAQEGQEEAVINHKEEMNKLGERAQEKIQMAERLLLKAPLSNNEREAIASSLNNADAINGFLKYHQAMTNENIPIQSAPSAPEMTRADLESAIADPRWTSDAGWRTKIEQQWMAAQNQS